MAKVPDDIEQTLRRHFEGQGEDLEVDGLRGEIAAVRGERAARLSERLPGGG